MLTLQHTTENIQKQETHIIYMESFKVIIVEDVKLELKGTEQIFHSEIPEAEIIGTAATETEFWKLMRAEEIGRASCRERV